MFTTQTSEECEYPPKSAGSKSEKDFMMWTTSGQSTDIDACQMTCYDVVCHKLGGGLLHIYRTFGHIWNH